MFCYLLSYCKQVQDVFESLEIFNFATTRRTWIFFLPQEAFDEVKVRLISPSNLFVIFSQYFNFLWSTVKDNVDRERPCKAYL